MPITMPYTDPTDVSPIPVAYVWAAEVNFNFADKTAHIVYFVHRSEAAAYAGKAPIKSVAIDIGPTSRPADGDTPAVPSFDELIAANAATVNALATAVYALAMTQTNLFPGAVTIPSQVQ